MAMITVTQTEFRNQIRKYMDAVERGEAVEICRHGRPVAALVPRRSSTKEYWRKVRAHRIDGVSLSRAILEEREEGW
jgi:prevent-host-death family protein